MQSEPNQINSILGDITTESLPIQISYLIINPDVCKGHNSLCRDVAVFQQCYYLRSSKAKRILIEVTQH